MGRNIEDNVKRIAPIEPVEVRVHFLEYQLIHFSIQSSTRISVAEQAAIALFEANVANRRLVGANVLRVRRPPIKLQVQNRLMVWDGDCHYADTRHKKCDSRRTVASSKKNSLMQTERDYYNFVESALQKNDFKNRPKQKKVSAGARAYYLASIRAFTAGSQCFFAPQDSALPALPR